MPRSITTRVPSVVIPATNDSRGRTIGAAGTTVVVSDQVFEQFTTRDLALVIIDNGPVGGSNFLEVRATPPNDHLKYPAYLDSSTTPPTLQVWNGTAYVALSGGTVTPGPVTPVAPAALKNHRTGDYAGVRTILDGIRAGTAHGRYFIGGDSTAAGALADSFAANYVSRLTRKLNESIPCEQTWCFPHLAESNTETLDPRVGLGGGAWTDFGGTFWFHPAGDTTPWTYAPCDTSLGGPATVDTFEIWTYGGTFNVTVSGVATQTWTDPAALTKHVITCPLGVKTISVVATSNAVIGTCNAYSSARKVLQTANRGINGQTSTPFTDVSHDYSIGAFAAVYKPHLTSIVLGINDFGQPGVTAAGTAAAIGSIVDHCNDNPGANALIHTQYPTGTPDRLALETQFASIIGTTADSLSCAVLDIFNDWGGTHTAHADRFADAAHPNTTGYFNAADTTAAAVLAL